MFKVLIFIVFCSSTSALWLYNFNSIELMVIDDLTKTLEIRQCVFIKNDKTQPDILSDFKHSALKNFTLTYLTLYELIQSVASSKNVYYKTGILLKESTRNIVTLLKIFDHVEETYKISNYVWIVLTEDDKLQTNDLIIPCNCEFIIIQAENETNYKLSEVYKVKNRRFINSIGMWNYNSGLNLTDVTFYRRRLNFNETYLNVLVFNEVRRCGFDKLTCLVFDVIDDFSNMMNFRIHYMTISLTHKLTRLPKEGDILGFPGMLHFIIDTNHISYTLMFKTILNWYIKYPSIELRSDYYLQPFETKIWLILFTIIITATAITVLTIYKNFKTYFIENFFIGLDTFCNQCGSDQMRNNSIKIIRLTLQLTAIVTVTSYGAVITSFLAVDTPEIPFTNLEEFVQNGQYRFHTYENAFLDNYFRASSNPVLQNILNNFTTIFEDAFYDNYTFQDMYKKICEEKLATIDYDRSFHKTNLSCPVLQIKAPIGMWFHILILKLHSPLKWAFDINFLRFYEYGIQKRMQKILDDSSGSVKKFDKDAFRPIEINQMVQVLSIPFIGAVLGFVIFTIEIIITLFK